MHELSIAQSILEIIKENVNSEDTGKVRKILLEIGDMSGIVSDSLNFCFDAVKLESPFENSTLEIINIPFVLFCRNCNQNTTNNYGLRLCEKCGGFDTEIISGTEMKIKEIELI